MACKRVILCVFFFVVILNLLTVHAQKKGNVCSQPRIVGPCRALQRRFYYDINSNACKIFFYGGCAGNDNNFERKADCRAACVRN